MTTLLLLHWPPLRGLGTCTHFQSTIRAYSLDRRNSQIILRPRPGYVPKVPTTKPSGEPASAAPGGGRPSPGFALSRPSIETLRWQDAKLQDLRPALCLSWRPAERECRLQAEDGPLDSGCHHPGLSGTGCALPVQVESSLYEKCSVLLGAGSWRLADRYL